MVDLTVKTGQNSGLKIIVSKKVAPLAVSRNRIKRLIRESVAGLGVKDPALKVIVKNNFEDAKMPEVKKAIEAAVNKANYAIKSN